MPILPVPAPSSSFTVGLRAVVRAADSRLVVFVALPSARLYSASRFPSRQPCTQHSSWGVARPFKPLYETTPPTLPSHVRRRSLFRFRVVTHYINLPDSYTDAEGLPFRREDLSQREVNRIFPTNLQAERANLLLKILHGRRVAGTLDDPSLAWNTRDFRANDQKKALEYLRKHIPVDEVLNAGLRAEDELQTIEQEGSGVDELSENSQATAEPHSPLGGPEEDVIAPTGRLPKKPGSDSPYGESNFDRIRAKNIARREAEEARLEEERRLDEELLGKENVGTLQTEQAKPRELSEWTRKYMERATSDFEAPPEMSARQRLLPTIALTAVIVAGSVIFAILYEAPPSSRRLFPDIPPAAATCLALIAANLAIWGLWKFPPAWALFNKYMILVVATPRPLQVLGAMFSHQSFGHLATNMVCLWFFGTRLHDEIGRGNFLALYCASGTIGFATSLVHLVLRGSLGMTSLGASGAIYGILTAFFWMHKFDEFKIFGYPPDPLSGPQGLGFIGLILGIHLIPFFWKRVSNIDIVSHLGGMLAGLVGIDLARYYTDYKSRMRAQRLASAGVVEPVIDQNAPTSTVVNITTSPSPEQ
ncbi:hypothetical protein F4808DRAFT_406442 [Astrocystis sublimbata]|nr:hypothetical protein F4808DRAFT_406442 [Astrocystis sublimbata]